MRVVYALWLREMKRYWRTRQNIAVSLAQPVLNFLVLGFALRPVYQKAGGGDFVQFLAPGIVGMTVMFAAIGSGVGLLFDRQFGFLKETLVAPVPRFQIMLGRTCGSATVAGLQGLLVAVACLVAGFRPVAPWGAAGGLALLILILIAIAFAGLGTAIGASMKDMTGYQGVINLLVIPLGLLSGVLFPLEHLPVVLATLNAMDPLTYGVDGMRALLIGQAHFSVLLDMAVLTCTAVVFLAIAAWRFTKIEP